MKILFLARRFYPEVGGVEKHVEKISKLLIGQGHQVVVLCEEPSKKSPASAANYHSAPSSDSQYLDLKQPVKSSQSTIFEGKKIAIARLKLGKNDWFKKFRIWAQIINNYSLFLSADVIHCHDVFFWYMPLRVLLPHKKVFVTFHGYETKFPPTRNAKIIRKLSELMSYGNICVGKYIEKWYGTRADFITYGGVDGSKNKNNFPKKTGDKLRILLLGRLEKDNGVEIYLDLFKKLVDQGIRYELITLGDGAYSKQLSKYGKVLGFDRKINDRIMNSDIVFASSYLSILEALSLGKRVFAVYQNELKKDYLNLSPFKKYIFVAQNADEILDQIENGKVS